MRIILIRHAKAEERDGRKFPDDGLRPLTAQGIDEQKVFSQALQRIGVIVDGVACSPLVRARETAEVLVEGLEWSGTIEVASVWGMDFTVDRAIRWLQRFPMTARIACVGHEPDLSELAAALLTTDDNFMVTFKKSAVMGIDFDDRVERGHGTLVYFLPPKMILPLAE